ncbi:MAG: iron reductase [Candidatus Dojkabacteria bacterium]|nr:MAG: iron reductase [Candidatus Dojkabacteria bacterium]
MWLLAKYQNNETINLDTLPRLLSQIFGLIGIILLSLSYILSARIIQLEEFFGGLDKVYKLHSFIGKIALVFILSHPILLLSENLSLFAYYFVPFYKNQHSALNAGIIALYLYLTLILISIFRFLPYEMWKFTHKLIGIPFFFASFHALNSYSDVKNYLPLFAWVLFVSIAGILAYIYKTFLYNYFGPRYLYEVIRVKHFGDIGELYLKPVKNRLNFEPGQFAFLSFIDNPIIPKEHHPFSFSSSPYSDVLRFSYKELGDYSSALKHAKVGDKVYVYGPYGEFTSYNFSEHKKQLWIAGGIGVTPFLSMLSYEIKNEDSKKIIFYYSTKREDECVYYDEISNLCKNADDKIKFINHCSDLEGYLNYERILSDVKDDLKDYLILICGPESMKKSLTKILIENGIKKNQIVFEEFNFV